MNKSIKIGNRKIGRNYPPFVIAEISANHNGSIEDAKILIDLAKKNGADAVKIQTYRPDTITLNSINMKQLLFLITALILTSACQRSVAQKNNTKVDNNKTPMVEMQTNMGTLKIKLYDNTPQHRDNFIKLVEQGFYDSGRRSRF